MRRPTARPRRAAIRVEPLEDRSLPSFVAAPTVRVGPNGGDESQPVAIVSGDFNRDGKLDLATANAGANGVSVLLGLGTGGYRPAINIGLGRSPTGLLAADVNADGKLDLVTANKADTSVTVLLGNGLGGFKSAGTVPAGTGPEAVAAGDFNGDGKVDLAVANRGVNAAPGNTVTILTGLGTGKFNSGGTVTVGNQPTSVAVGDFNADGWLDLASVSEAFGNLTINLNNGDGTFGAGVKYTTGSCANDLVVGDFNHDQKLDVAVACVFPSNNGVSVLLGVGDGTFPTFTNYEAGGQTPKTLAAADLNNDGNLDLVTANDQFANNSVSVLLGDPDGTFNPAAFFAANQGPVDVAVGDLNGDGWVDAAVVGTGKPIGTTGELGTVATLLGNGDGTLSAPANLKTGGDPGSQVAADFTGDDQPDLAVVASDGSFQGVMLFPGLGTGAFGPRLLTASVNQAVAVAVGDFNGDQKRDLAVATEAGVSVLPGNGDGTFGTPVAYAVAGTPNWVTVGDFNGDQKADLVLATATGASVLIGNGDGTFQAPLNVAIGEETRYVVTADFNRDGKADLASISSADHLNVHLGNGDGTFGPVKAYDVDHSPNGMAVGDFNRDGKPDLAVTTFFGPGLMVFQNGTAGRFALRAVYQTDSLPIGCVVADWNGDGRPDLGVINKFGDTAQFFNGNGLGTFGKPARYVVGSFPSWGSVADFNGDGRPDLAVSNNASGSVTLLATPTPAAGFRVTVAPAATAGKPTLVVVTAVDATGRLAPQYAGTVRLTSTDGKARLPLPYRFTAADHGTHRFAVTLRTAGSRDVTAGYGAVTGTGTVQVAAAKAVKLRVVAPATATAGTPFDLTVQAVDPYGNPDPTYAGTVHFTSTDLNAGITLPADYTFTPGDGGSHTFAGVTLLTAGARSITVAGGAWRATAAVKVGAGALSRFDVTGLPATVTANVVRYITVMARDAYGNTIKNYVGTVQFGNMGGMAVLPAPYTFKATDLGRRVFKVTFQTPGAGQSLTVFDQADPGISGSVTGITVV